MNSIINRAIIGHLKTLDTDDLISIHNTYCQENNYSDDEIYGNDEDFFETFFHNNPYEVARSTFYGTYNFSEDYVRFNGYGNLETLSTFTTEDFPVSVSEIAEAIESDPSLYNIDIDDTFPADLLPIKQRGDITLEESIKKYLDENPETTRSDLEEAIDIYSIL